VSTRDEDAVAPTLAAETSGKSLETHATDDDTPAIPASRRIQLIPTGTLVGRYVIAERLGWGGMGVVYRARDPRLGREVALKLVMTIGDVEAAQVRLETEAQAMAKLNHPNVVAVHDIGAYNDQLFIAMELCSGGSLARWIKKPQPWRAIVARFIAAGHGLAAAHRIGLVHRDFKPDNVLLATDGSVKVSDFGLVRHVDRDSATEAIEGTPAYMAPEQLELGVVDARADQFAFGVSMWEALCGTVPFRAAATTTDVLAGTLEAIRARRRLRGDVVAAPKRLLKIVERSLEPEPAARWPSLDDMLRALEAELAPSRAPFAIAAGVVAAIGIGIAAYALTRPPPVDQALPKKLAAEVAPLYEVVAQRTVDSTVAARMYRLALAASGDPKFRLALGRTLVLAEDCGAIAELDRYSAETRRSLLEALSDDDHHRAVDLRAHCADDPSSAMEDADEIEHLADQLDRNAPDKAILALGHALRVARGKKLTLYLKLGDYASDYGDCATAIEAFEEYIRLAQPTGADLASVRTREAPCKER